MKKHRLSILGLASVLTIASTNANASPACAAMTMSATGGDRRILPIVDGRADLGNGETLSVDLNGYNLDANRHPEGYILNYGVSSTSRKKTFSAGDENDEPVQPGASLLFKGEFEPCSVTLITHAGQAVRIDCSGS